MNWKNFWYYLAVVFIFILMGTSIDSLIHFSKDTSGWRFKYALIGSLLTFPIFLAGIYTLYKRFKK